MTPDEFKTWRLAKGLSHQEAADLLGASSRFVVMRWEKGSEMPSTLAARITEAESVLAATPPGEKPPGRPPFKEMDYSAHKHWSLSGRPMTMQEMWAKPLGYQFYRLDSPRDIDPATGHLKANMYERTRARPHGAALYFALDLEAWNVVCLAWQTHPAHIAALPKLNALLQAKPVDNSPDENKPSFFL